MSATCWRQTYKNIIDQEFLDNISVERRKLGRANWFSQPNKFSIIALYQGKIIGFCDFGESSHPEFAQGEIYALYILSEYHRCGIGSKLISQAILLLKQQKLEPIIVLALGNYSDPPIKNKL